MSIEMIDTRESRSGTVIKVIGVGGCGCNVVDHMIERQIQGVEFICTDTNVQALSHRLADTRIQLGHSGRSAGGKPEKGKEAAEASADHIRQSLRGAHMLFIIAGMGGGTGTGAAPMIARIAKDMGILTVGIVTKPFEWEGKRRASNAENGLTELEANVDSLVVMSNATLLEEQGDDDITMEEAFERTNDVLMNAVLKNAVSGIAKIINDCGNVNVDFKDVRAVMGEPGKAMIGTATASGPDRARIAAEQAVACPLLEGIDLSGAKGVLVLITASKSSLKLSESREAMNTIRAYTSSEAETVYGAAYDDSLGDVICVTVIATGLQTTCADIMLHCGGMDDMDIPAFWRKHRDVITVTPRVPSTDPPPPPPLREKK